MSMLIEVWGDYACFTRPEMKTERVSYDMITPSAARGLVEAIYWHPGLRYTVDRIYLLKPFGLDPEDEASTEEYTQRPIRFTNIRRNEVKSTLLSSAALSCLGQADERTCPGDGLGGQRQIHNAGLPHQRHQPDKRRAHHHNGRPH